MVYLPTPTWCFAGKCRETYTCHTSILWDEVGPLKGPFYFCFRSGNLVVKYIIPISVYHSNTITARDYKGMMVVNSPLKRPYLMEMVAFGVVPWDFHFITISMAMALRGGHPCMTISMAMNHQKTTQTRHDEFFRHKSVRLRCRWKLNQDGKPQLAAGGKHVWRCRWCRVGSKNLL